jgi:hypothetical protein
MVEWFANESKDMKRSVMAENNDDGGSDTNKPFTLMAPRHSAERHLA